MTKANGISAMAAIALAFIAAPASARGFIAVHSVYYVASLPVVVVQPQRVQRDWVPGHWEWEGDRHAWVPGHWQLPARAYSYAD